MVPLNIFCTLVLPQTPDLFLYRSTTCIFILTLISHGSVSFISILMIKDKMARIVCFKTIIKVNSLTIQTNYLSLFISLLKKFFERKKLDIHLK